METSFNLIDRPWIPCVISDEQHPRELSLRETLARSPDIIEISDPSPLVTVALHRLLLAVLHRVYGPDSAGDWAELWERGRDGWNMAKLDAYLDDWRHRFELFDGERPFYQSATIETTKSLPSIKLPHQVSLASGTLFDHAQESNPPILAAGEAARELVAHQAFSIGGLVTPDSGTTNKYAKAGSLTKAAVTLVRGTSLFETLLLNLHRYSAHDGQPFEGSEDDAPTWEQPVSALPDERRPSGYLDLLTWQSRRIRLVPSIDEHGDTVVMRVTIMKGFSLPADWHEVRRDPMVGFHRRLKARGKQDPWAVLQFSESRSFWRDSLPLFQSIQARDRQFERPRMLDWLGDLSELGVISGSQAYAVEVLGMATHPQHVKIHLWRHERFPLPLSYLNDEQLFARLREAVDLAEEAGRVVSQGVWSLARLLLAPESDRQDERAPDRSAVSALAESFGTGRAYWAQLDELFAGLLVRLDRDQRIDEYGDYYYGENVLPRWRETLRTAAYRAWEDTIAGLDLSARELKASARASRSFRIGLARALESGDRDERTEEEHD